MAEAEKVRESKEELDNEPVVTRVEEDARKGGWKPQEEWEGEPDDWVSAGEFMRRKSLFDKIHNQNRQMRKLEEAMTALQSHHKKVFEASYKRALRDLQAQKIEAAKEGDAAAVVEIDDQIAQMNTKYQEDAKSFETPKSTVDESEFQDWVKDNQWYMDDKKMRAYADRIGVEYARNNPHLTNSEVFDFVREEVEFRYPDKFGGEGKQQKSGGRPTAPTVESGNKGAKGSRSKVQLTEEERSVMKTLVKSGVMTEEEYMAEIAKIQ